LQVRAGDDHGYQIALVSRHEKSQLKLSVALMGSG